MVLSKTLAKDILVILNTSAEKVRNQRGKKENIHKSKYLLRNRATFGHTAIRTKNHVD
jgi:hypothetical protein